MKNYVAYYRVSTKQQGASGLGLESQKSIVEKFIGENKLVASFTEIESGKNNTRVELLKAIDYAKTKNATLIIAKLDRLSRNVQFIFALRDSGVNFTCCDIPDANTMTIGIFALLAQQERELISERTKAALQAKKARGAVLGTPANLTKDARQKSIEVRKTKATATNLQASAFSKALKLQGMTLRATASELNKNGFKSSTGKSFEATTVKRLLERN